MMLTFHVFSAIFYCMFHICICNSLVIHLEYINVALHLQNRNEKSCYLCIINVYILYTYKNDSIYGSVMNIFGCVHPFDHLYWIQSYMPKVVEGETVGEMQLLYGQISARKLPIKVIMMAS